MLEPGEGAVAVAQQHGRPRIGAGSAGVSSRSSPPPKPWVPGSESPSRPESSLPSALKSPTATGGRVANRGDDGAGTGRCHRRCPSSTGLAVSTPPARGHEVELAVGVEVAHCQRQRDDNRSRRSRPAWNVPSPLPRSTLTLLLKTLTTARSSRPSRLKSAVTTAMRIVPGGVARPGLKLSRQRSSRTSRLSRCVAARSEPRRR